MGWGKTLLAAAGGFLVGGPVGAVVAGGAAAAAQKAMANNEEQERSDERARENAQKLERLKQTREQRETESKKKEEAKLKRQEAERKKAEARIQRASAEKDQLIIACIAIGMAAGNVDGEMSDDEKAELKFFIDKLQEGEEFSETVKAKIQEYENKPPSFIKAKKEIDKIANPDLELFRTIIEHIIHSDNQVSPEEEDFMEQWNHFYPQRQ